MAVPPFLLICDRISKNGIYCGERSVLSRRVRQGQRRTHTKIVTFLSDGCGH